MGTLPDLSFVTAGFVLLLIAAAGFCAFIGFGVGLLLSPLFSWLPDSEEEDPGVIEAPMRAPLSPSARLAWLLWLIALGGAAALLCAAGAARAAPLEAPAAAAFASAHAALWAVLPLALALALSVASVAAGTRRPRGGM